MPFGQGARTPTGSQMFDRAKKGLENSGDAWQIGALNPTKHPLTAAAASGPKWKAGVEAAAQNDRFVKGIKAVSEEDMVDAIRRTPSSAVLEGFVKREAKTRKRLDKLAGITAANAAVIDGMPNTTGLERRARLLKQYDLGLLTKDRMRA